MADELRREVRLLGSVLGQVLTETEGPDLLADVERLRRAVVDGPTADQEPEEPARLAATYSPERAEQIAQAFTVYFQLVNLAEERQRVRTLGARPIADRPDTFAAVHAELGADLIGLLPGLRVHPVLTAHPTEARRRAVISAIGRISAALDAADETRLLEQITILWRTAQVRRNRPEPLDEVRTAMAVFDSSLFALVPSLYRSLEAALSGPLAGSRAPLVPAYLRYGSWIGGDRDGNPQVRAATTLQTLDIQTDHVLRALAATTAQLGRTLTLDAHAVPPSDQLRAALSQAHSSQPALLQELTITAPGEPHRQYLLYAAARLVATRTKRADLAYRQSEEFQADLKLVQTSLAGAGVPRVAYGDLQDLVWQAETFGFHLAELEVRQHASVHAEALRTVGLAPEDVATLDSLACGRSATRPAAPEEDPCDVLGTLRTMAAVQERWGASACRRYIVSFTSCAADLLAVRALARLAAGDRPFSLEVVPLFETHADLLRAVEVLDSYLEFESTQQALRATGGRLEVMLGYSDSAKDVGPVSATFALYEAQARLVDWARRHGITLTLFHGRGGALGRGGGPAGRAVLSGAPGALNGRFKVTEQGEVIFARYGSPAIGLRHLEQVTSSVLLASTPRVEQRTAQAAVQFGPLAEVVGRAAMAEYRGLTATEGFAEFVRQVSPLEELGLLHLGSRPARRAAGGDLASLRAIPWVFAWAQTRCNLPGWYGLGSGLAEAARTKDGLDQLRAAYAQWPLFTSLLDNAEMSLAKTDRFIAARYLALGGRPELADRILAELDRSVQTLLAVLDQDRLLQAHPVLNRAIDLRNPYVDALSHLQLRALSALRAESQAQDPDDSAMEANRRLLLLTINGVAAGLQNTG